MKKEIIIVLLVIGVLFIAGCKKTEPTSDGPFIGGSGGVQLSFSESAPLSEFDQGESIPFKVKLTNKGEYDIPKGEANVKLFGFTNFNGLEIEKYKVTSGILYGISKIRAEGGEQIVDFGSGVYNKEVIGEFTDLTIHSMVCYPYKTKTNVKVCMSSRRIKETEGQEICAVEGEKALTGTTSAAPIQVTSITEELKGSNSLLFKIDIQNMGTGDVFDNTISCENYEPLVNQDIISVKVTPSDLVCDFLEGGQGTSGKIKLIDGKKSLYCEKTLENKENSYQDDLIIDMDYKYMESGSTAVKIYSK